MSESRSRPHPSVRPKGLVEWDSAMVGPAVQEAELNRRTEDEAIYLSRRAREERRASLKAGCRKCRQTHLELADAYELRAHVLTHETRRRARSPLQHAL